MRRGSASIWCSGLKGWASGPGTAAAKDRRDFPAQRPPAPAPQAQSAAPSGPLLSRLKKLHGPLPGFVEDLLTKAPQHPPHTRGQVPRADLSAPPPDRSPGAPTSRFSAPGAPHLLASAAAGLARPRARATAEQGAPPTPRRGCRSGAGLSSPALPLAEGPASHPLRHLSRAPRTAVSLPGWGCWAPATPVAVLLHTSAADSGRGSPPTNNGLAQGSPGP